MDKKILLFLIIWCLLGKPVPCDASEKKYHIYETQTYDTIEIIAKRFLSSHQREYGNHLEEYINDLKFWNPHITNWKLIPESTQVYVDYPYPPFPAPRLTLGNSEEESHEYSEAESDSVTEENAPQVIQTELSNIPNVPEVPGYYKLFAMVTLSEGTFSEKLHSGAVGIQSQQNSPLTLGLGGNYHLDGNERILAASAYFSMLRMSQVSGDTGGTTNTISVPMEIGANFYNQNFLQGLDINLYEGVDYEKFSTFNTIAYNQESVALALNSNTLILGTLGIAKSFSINDYVFSTKFSASTILNSTSSGGSENKYTGQRILIFASLRGANQFSYNFLYKRHMLKGPTNLTIERIGIGLSYELF